MSIFKGLGAKSDRQVFEATDDAEGAHINAQEEVKGKFWNMNINRNKLTDSTQKVPSGALTGGKGQADGSFSTTFLKKFQRRSKEDGALSLDRTSSSSSKGTNTEPEGGDTNLKGKNTNTEPESVDTTSHLEGEDTNSQLQSGDKTLHPEGGDGQVPAGMSVGRSISAAAASEAPTGWPFKGIQANSNSASIEGSKGGSRFNPLKESLSLPPLALGSGDATSSMLSAKTSATSSGPGSDTSESEVGAKEEGFPVDAEDVIAKGVVVPPVPAAPDSIAALTHSGAPSDADPTGAGGASDGAADSAGAGVTAASGAADVTTVAGAADASPADVSAADVSVADVSSGAGTAMSDASDVAEAAAAGVSAASGAAAAGVSAASGAAAADVSDATSAAITNVSAAAAATNVRTQSLESKESSSSSLELPKSVDTMTAENAKLKTEMSAFLAQNEALKQKLLGKQLGLTPGTGGAGEKLKAENVEEEEPKDQVIEMEGEMEAGKGQNGKALASAEAELKELKERNAALVEQVAKLKKDLAAALVKANRSLAVGHNSLGSVGPSRYGFRW